MRSGLIFGVSTRFSNRFLLCRMLSAGARKMHRDGVSTSQCINNSLIALYESPAREAPREPVVSPPDAEVPDVEVKDPEQTAEEASAASQS